MKFTKSWAAAAAMLALTGAAQAALVSLGDGTVKDTNTNLIWLQDWDRNGAANWGSQKAWAEGLDFAGSTQWELPELGEYVALFTAYGNLTRLAAFTNVQPGFYWSGTVLVPGSFAGLFIPASGLRFDGDLPSPFSAVAVRRGDVTASVPEPQTLALALLALGATVVARSRRSR
jgi:hypothetical protein